MRLSLNVRGLLLAVIFIIATAAPVSAQQSQTNNQTQNPQIKPRHAVEVKPGDTLVKIAEENKTTFQKVFDVNVSIEDPDLIYPGDKVQIPHADENPPSRPLPADVQVVSQPAAQSGSSGRTFRPTAARTTAASGNVWDQLAQCESGGNWGINTGNGYYGGLQFNLGTWRSNGGSGYPHEASREEQIRVAENLRAARGFAPWPACSAKLGLR